MEDQHKTMTKEQETVEAWNQIQNQSDGFIQHNHIRVTAIEEDYTAVELEIVPESCNPYGIPHGGAYYTMADTAAGIAARRNGRRYVTQNSAMQFISTVTGGTVRAEARVIHRGRTTCVVRSEIRSDTGKLLVTGDFTFFCIDK